MSVLCDAGLDHVEIKKLDKSSFESATVRMPHHQDKEAYQEAIDGRYWLRNCPCGSTLLVRVDALGRIVRSPKCDAAVGKTFERLRVVGVIARLLMAVPHGGPPEVSLQPSDEACDMLSAIAGATTTTYLYRRPGRDFAIVNVRAVVNGVTFRSQRRDRDVTQEERQRLDREGQEHERLVTA